MDQEGRCGAGGREPDRVQLVEEGEDVRQGADPGQAGQRPAARVGPPPRRSVAADGVLEPFRQPQDQDDQQPAGHQAAVARDAVGTGQLGEQEGHGQEAEQLPTPRQDQDQQADRDVREVQRDADFRWPANRRRDPAPALEVLGERAHEGLLQHELQLMMDRAEREQAGEELEAEIAGQPKPTRCTLAHLPRILGTQRNSRSFRHRRKDRRRRRRPTFTSFLPRTRIPRSGGPSWRLFTRRAS